MTHFKRTISLLRPIPMALAAVFGSGSLWAQTAQGTADPAVTLETVIVKAQRRDEKLQDVPVAVKAFSARQIEDAGITSTQDFINMTPNMSFDHSYTYQNSFVVIRGVSQINNADSPVAVVVDGVPQNDQKQLKMNLFDVQSIEVLKGPQGALYGRNAIGGAIVIETKKPTNELQSFVKGDYSSGNTKELQAGVSGSIVPDLVRFRIVAENKSSDGTITNTFLNKGVDSIDHDTSVRAKLTVDASDDVRLDFRASLQDYRAGSSWDSLVVSGNPNAIVLPNSNIAGVTWGKTSDFSFKADVTTGLGVLTAISAYTNLVENNRADMDFTNLANPLGGLVGPPPPNDIFGGLFGTNQFLQGQDRTVKTFSQELRMTSATNQPLRWIGGLFYLDSTRDMAQSVVSDHTGNINQWDQSSPADLMVFGPPSHDRFAGKASAVFGQLDYDIDTKTTLSGALRYDRDTRSRTDMNAGTSIAHTFDAWQPKFTLTRRLDADSLAYGTYSTGFRSGLFNSTNANTPMVEAENLQNFEIGYKGSFLDKRMTFNVAAFNSTSKNFQFFYVSNFTQVIGNIDKVSIKGLDADLRFAPTRGLEFDAGLGLTDSVILANAAQPATVGNHAPKDSPWKLTLGAQYTAPIGGGMLGFGRFDIEDRSEKYWHPDNVAVSSGFALYNIRVGLRQEKDKWSVNLYGRNLTNVRYYADFNSQSYSGWPGAVGAIGSLAPGRTLGVDTTFRF